MNILCVMFTGKVIFSLVCCVFCLVLFIYATGNMIGFLKGYDKGRKEAEKSSDVIKKLLDLRPLLINAYPRGSQERICLSDLLYMAEELEKEEEEDENGDN